MKTVQKDFSSHKDLVTFALQNLCVSVKNNGADVGAIKGGREEALKALKDIKPKDYVSTRNFIDGAVTWLSPYIRHGILTLEDVRQEALTHVDTPEKIEKFIQELAWREFWQRLYVQQPDYIWNNIEDYKTGLSHDDYADELPEDIRKGETPVACLNHFIGNLINDGYVHNHARMYLASYVVHFRRVKWQAGAQWFLTHLLDGDPASNNLSWQWVASTFSNKPYIFNLDNVRKYATDDIDTSSENNEVLDYSYDELNERLFPKKGQINA